MLPSQTEDTWKVIASNIHRIKERRSNQAACIVFVQNASDNNHNGTHTLLYNYWFNPNIGVIISNAL